MQQRSTLQCKILLRLIVNIYILLIESLINKQIQVGLAFFKNITFEKIKVLVSDFNFKSVQKEY